MSDTHRVTTDPANSKNVIGCIDLCYSPDDGGWYAQQYDFTRKDNATRTSSKIYPTREALAAALDGGKHRWQRWD